jgi:hypothetical protein
MNEHTRAANLSPQTKRAQGGVGAPHLHEDGPDGDLRGPREGVDPGDHRHGDGGTHTDHSQVGERKDTGSTQRQGGTGEANR